MADAVDRGTIIPQPFAAAAHLYLLAAGVLLGVALGPAVLGRLSPQTYDAWFVGAGEEAAQLAREEAALQQQLTMLRGVGGVTEVAEQELLEREGARLAPMKLRVQAAQEEVDRRTRGWLGALVAAVVLLAVAEALLAPDVRPEQGGSAVVPRLLPGVITARYAMLALWLAICIARPVLLMDLPLLLMIALLVVALVAAAAPLGRAAPRPS